ETFVIMEEIPLCDPTYFTLDHDWSLLSFLLYRQQCDDFTANKCGEHKRYIRNLLAIVESEGLSETTYDLAYVALNAVQWTGPKNNNFFGWGHVLRSTTNTPDLAQECKSLVSSGSVLPKCISLDGVTSCVQSPNTLDLAQECMSLVSGGSQEKKSELIDDFWTNAISTQKRKIEALSERSALVEELTTTTNVTRQLAGAGGDNSLPNKRPCMIQKEDSAEECATQEDLLNSIIETSNIFEKVPSYYDKLKTIWNSRDSGADYYIIDLGNNEMMKQTHELLCEDELKMLSERLTLNDENNHISTKAHEYLALFDQIIGYPSGEKTTKANNLIDLNDDNDAKSSVISEMEKTLHSLNEITTKFRYLSNSLSLPVLHYDQSQYPDIHIIK
ncbi:9771_t:CDS:2, partial [Funneliformis caledonium]